MRIATLQTKDRVIDSKINRLESNLNEINSLLEMSIIDLLKSEY